jgi:L-arabinose isomerase
MAHMGECNPNLSGAKPVLKTVPFKYGKLSDPAVAVGGFRPGEATLVNLVSIGGDEYRLTAAEVEIPEFPILDLTMPHFKVRPRMDLGAFLSLYSEFGGSHHLAIVPGCVGRQVELLADLTELDFAPA